MVMHVRCSHDGISRNAG